MKVRVRFGIRGASWLFPNATVMVLRQVNKDQFKKLVEIVGALKEWLTVNGHDDVAQRIVCEES